MKQTLIAICLLIGQQNFCQEELQRNMLAAPTDASTHKALAYFHYENDAFKALLASGVYTVYADSLNLEVIEAFRKLVVGETIANENGEVVIMLNDEMLSGSKKDDFGVMQFFLQMNHAALSNPEVQDLTYREILYTTFNKMTNVLAETGHDKKGFFWENYVPFYLTLQREGQMPSFIEVLLLNTRTQIDDTIEAPINMEDVAGFKAWLANYSWRQ